MLQLKIVTITAIWWWCTWHDDLHGAVVVVADPQTNLINKGCSSYSLNGTDLKNLHANVNGTVSTMRGEITGSGKYFGTSQETRGEVATYALFQCRDYLSQSDCVACFDAAAVQNRNCSDGSNGARVTFDGCFLRYDSDMFYDKTTEPGNDGVLCGSMPTSETATTFGATVTQALKNLQLATPRIKGFFAATKTLVASGGGSVYAVAQCVETATESSCLDCLTFGFVNLKSNCIPNIDGGSSNKWGIIGGVGGGIALFVIISIALFVWYKRSNNKKEEVHRGDILGATELKGPINYSYNDLKAATENFSENNKLGEGGFGDVYKGILENGKVVAVKKLILSQSKKMKDDFETEVKLISNVHHRNLLRLLGCCNKGQERILVYEYMANKSLDKFLFGDKKGFLNWRQRFDIIIGTARGLTYLHEEFHVSIIHRDIKTSNILLDDEFQPKIADFGLARLLPRDQSHLSTRFAGTMGYTAPEYAIHGQLSEKTDVYSYGIVVLEIISGKKCTEVKIGIDNGQEYLLQQAWKLYEQGRHIELVDESINPNEYDKEEVKKIIEIALLCTQASATMRPAMSKVVILLSSNNKGLFENIQPSMPTFIESTLKAPEDDIFATNNNSSTPTNSTVSGR
ncbi:cysteine-rich receptor-like protein kinase 43 isoform X3 [Arachis hypogaea]|uniref:cysteine-rich receptor-like protein kinase 43 isoform X3 n=1 Tax=Arachis hypogaea TaxID=3818 RepID=UPI0034E73DAF